MRDDDRKRARQGGPSLEADARVEDRYEAPRILKKRAVARIAQSFSGAGPTASGPLLVGNG